MWNTIGAVPLVSALALAITKLSEPEPLALAPDPSMMNVPLLNKFYGAIKQVNEAFSGNKNSFKTVVMVEFPSAGMYSIGFITNEQNGEVQQKTKENVVCVFVPTTPNPTSGFLILVPEDKVKKLDMSVADGIKYIVSLGSISPEYSPPKIK